MVSDCYKHARPTNAKGRLFPSRDRKHVMVVALNGGIANDNGGDGGFAIRRGRLDMGEMAGIAYCCDV